LGRQLEHTGRIAEEPLLLGRKVDHTIGDHDIDGGIGIHHVACGSFGAATGRGAAAGSTFGEFAVLSADMLSDGIVGQFIGFHVHISLLLVLPLRDRRSLVSMVKTETWEKGRE
jgi:hypothetical protein